MTQKDILRKPTRVQLQHLEEFKRKIKEYRKKNNIKEEYEIPLLEFGENDTDKLRKRICDEFYEHTKPKEKLLYLQGKFTSDYEKWKRTINEIIQIRAPDIRTRGIAEEEMVAILSLIISAKTPFRETIMEIITKLEKDETQQISITKVFDEVDIELTNNGTKWFDQNRIKQPFQGKKETILSYIERFEKYMEVHHGFSTNIEKDKIKGELLIREFIKEVAPRVKKEQATLIHMNVSYGKLKKSLMKYSTYEKEERREQNCQINNIQDNRNNFKKPWNRNNNHYDRKNFYPRHNNDNFRKNNNKKRYTNYKNNFKPQFRKRNETTTVNHLSVSDTKNTKPEISLRIGQHYFKTLINTGSQINLIRKRTLDTIQSEHNN
uniref:Retrotransposon gag domain-containing protein n=1 Tax=Strongyloides venezuelensis TaxID=75913 RepID=A0A0K0FSL8_STRVS